jgi:hypothetical protein
VKAFLNWLRAIAQEMRESMCAMFGHAQPWNIEEQDCGGPCPRCSRTVEQSRSST